MSKDLKITWLKKFSDNELTNNILPFWREVMPDYQNDGFYGRVSFDGIVDAKAHKGLVLNARMLYTFSSAFQYTQNKVDKQLAERAFNYLMTYFYDKQFGGYFWTLDYTGKPADTKKQIYALAFVMYGLSTYYLISKDENSKQKAIEIFHLIEEKSFDKINNGYVEALTREWAEIGDMRLSVKDMNEKKTANTHLHILEAYSSLYKIYKDDTLEAKLENLIKIFTEKILSKKDGHLQLFFDKYWQLKSTQVSYGHDIEASWLLHEAAMTLGKPALLKEVEKLVPIIAEASLEGFSSQGGLHYEGDRTGKHIDNQYEWWSQSEALVGLINAYKVTNNENYLDIAYSIGHFIQDYFVDEKHSEWHYRVDENLKPVAELDKAGLWKCPYHNSRAFLKIIHMLSIN